MLSHAGLTRIADHLRETPERPRAIGELELAALFSLPARFENLETISYSRPEYLRDSTALLRYMHRYGIDLLVMPRAGTDIPNAFGPLLDDVTGHISRMPSAKRVEDESYLMFDLTTVADADWLTALDDVR